MKISYLKVLFLDKTIFKLIIFQLYKKILKMLKKTRIVKNFDEIKYIYYNNKKFY